MTETLAFGLAFDRAGSVRLMDEDGRLHVAATPISKAAVNSYYGREIPGGTALGLEPERLYRLLRDPVELARGAATFNSLPVLSEHAHVSAQTPRPDLVVGATGTDASFNAPYLTSALVLWNAQAIARVRSGQQRELSCAYRYVPVMEAGQYEGQPYDGRMTQIRGNHVALVSTGRAGPDVLVADEKPKENTMESSSSNTPPAPAGAEGTPAASTPGGKGLLAGQAFALLGTALASGRLAFGASLAELRACLNTFETTPPPAQDCPPDGADQQDMPPRPMAQDSAVQAAVDAALQAERQRNRQAADALALVRPLVGDVLGMDSAEDILRYALHEHGVETRGINLPGLRALAQARLGARAPHGGMAGLGAADAAAGVSGLYGVTAPRKI